MCVCADQAINSRDLLLPGISNTNTLPQKDSGFVCLFICFVSFFVLLFFFTCILGNELRYFTNQAISSVS